MAEASALALPQAPAVVFAIEDSQCPAAKRLAELCAGEQRIIGIEIDYRPPVRIVRKPGGEPFWRHDLQWLRQPAEKMKLAMIEANMSHRYTALFETLQPGGGRAQIIGVPDGR